MSMTAYQPGGWVLHNDSHGIRSARRSSSGPLACGGGCRRRGLGESLTDPHGWVPRSTSRSPWKFTPWVNPADAVVQTNSVPSAGTLFAIVPIPLSELTGRSTGRGGADPAPRRLDVLASADLVARVGIPPIIPHSVS